MFEANGEALTAARGAAIASKSLPVGGRRARAADVTLRQLMKLDLVTNSSISPYPVPPIECVREPLNATYFSRISRAPESGSMRF